MTEKDCEILLYCLNEMMEGHFRVMRALNTLKDHIEHNIHQDTHEKPVKT